MKATVVMVGAIGSMLFGAIALAAPPFAEPNRESGTYLFASTGQSVDGGYRYRGLTVADIINFQGGYERSYVSIYEYGYSYDAGTGYARSAECEIDRGAVKGRANGTAASANVYVADAQDQAVCSYYSYGIEPFKEIVADLAGNDPAGGLSQQSVGRVTSGQTTQQFSCSQSVASGFHNSTVELNGESWPASYMEASAHDCHSVSK
jgi:hypothetical protein